MKDILFIVNPKSGKGKKSIIPNLISRFYQNKNLAIDIIFTKYAGHASELIQEKKNLYKSFCAVGGDGTINECLSELISSDKKFGIIPLGSGNGFARHHKISLTPEQALKTFDSGKTTEIDTCFIQNRPFFNVAGFGFDAHIAAVFNKRSRRGFFSYAKLVVAEYFRYPKKTFTFILDGKNYSEQGILIAFANTNQFGNNAKIAPHANSHDGRIEVVVVKKIPFWCILSTAVLLFSGKFDKCRFSKNYSAKTIEFDNSAKHIAHLDGEPVLFSEKIINISIMEKAIKLIC